MVERGSKEEKFWKDRGAGFTLDGAPIMLCPKSHRVYVDGAVVSPESRHHTCNSCNRSYAFIELTAARQIDERPERAGRIREFSENSAYVAGD